MANKNLDRSQILASSQDNKEPTSLLSTTEELALAALVGNELYGLQIIDAFTAACEGHLKVSIGTLYPLLARLEQKGLISSRMEDGVTPTKGGARRKFFKITKNGAFTLSENQRFRNELQQWTPYPLPSF